MASPFESLLLSQVSYLLSNTPLMISTTTVSTVASVVLSVPSAKSFNNLKVEWRARNDSANPAIQMVMQFNGDTGNNYLWEINQANNTTVSATTSGAAVSSIQIATIPAATATALYYGSGSFTVGGAVDTTNYKTAQGTACAFSTATNMWTGVYSGQWLSTAAVTSITLKAASGNISGTFSLYGWN